MLDINKLIEKLKTGMVTVTFTKADGSERIMKCTMNLEQIPSEHFPKQESLPTPINENIVKVYEPAIAQWRSFRKDRVISFRWF